MTGTESGRFDDLPPSAKYVYELVKRDGPLTRQELLQKLPEPTVDRALDHLQNEDFIDKTRESEDLRKVVITTRAMRTYNPSRD
ncbi:helix-turn-helix domain-containing protein [Halosimplex pelagicum]|uniref:MarR family transcriptional regulator n=1 Tax=Halosimplex pelagicum TaxID=869886 RepID=A0A7D5PF94_9EURY|nr:helix-turn-helix domain-containing protein [Halosimplex pelagicum]QLH82479.1 MarR family transcriptional regulator [Halosimplex pelagicum]QLH82535.1 MarR family transcriptional regulator [Halosimplex pelagicum]